MKNIILKIGFLLLISCGCQANNDKYADIFDEVLNRIEIHYFNSKINNNNYNTLLHEYKTRVNKCNNDKEFISVVNSFLFTFDVSHIGFGKTTDIREKVSPYIWSEYTAGIDIRMIKGEVLVSAVNDSHPNSTKIKMGDRITEINNRSINDLLLEFVVRSPSNQRNYNFLRTEEILRHIYGYDKSNVYLTITSSSNIENTITLSREKRKNGIILFEGFPNVFLDINSKIYFETIGYIKFNAFQPSDPIEIIDRIEEFKNLPSLIIDLRGNNGGSVEATRRIVSELLKDTEIYYNLRRRNDTSRITFTISNNPYKGNLVILVDELSISAAEIFSDILQFTKSAVIVGLQTPGNVLSGELFSISSNYSLLLPVEDWIRNDGFRLEGNGVIPDHIIELKESDLIRGVDTQLNSAINLLK